MARALLAIIVFLATVSRASHAAGGSLPAPPSSHRIEIAFTLPKLGGNPFDFTVNNVQAILEGPHGDRITLPAFFDGGTTWKVRYWPPTQGRYRFIRFLRNGQPIKPGSVVPALASFVVKTPVGKGIIRLDPRRPARFRFNNGPAYYPVGNDAAWGKGGDDAYLLDLLTRMAHEGHENWARIWMDHWDGKNLDWETGKQGKFDQLDLDVARRWDRIMDTAERNGLYIQMTLQHHGPYTTYNDSNWNENPWNAKNGGFLQTPTDFFTDIRARALTRAKYRYIIARWGYSPNLFAWELFNEVQWCNPIRDHHPEIVTAWHTEMESFFRKEDVWSHLVTTSSDTNIPGLYHGTDFVQPHSYPPDIVTAVTAPDPVYDGVPYFFGEIGPGGRLAPEDERRFVGQALWASLMSASQGAAQYWFWDRIDTLKLFPIFASASDFVKAVGTDTLAVMRPVPVEIATPGAAGIVSVGPGAGWASANRTDLTVLPSGEIEGIATLPSFLQGRAHREMFPHADFHVAYGAGGGTFSVAVGQVSKSGGHLQLSLDDKVGAEYDFPAGAADRPSHETVTLPVPPGKHVVRVENTGADWLVINRYTLTPYGSALRVLGKSDGNRHAAIWVFRSAPAPGAKPVVAELKIAGLAPGRYRVRWWDIAKGKEAGAAVVAAGGRLPAFRTPPVADEIAAFIEPAK